MLLVGLTIGMMRTVAPALAESEFGLPKTSFLLLTSFVEAVGLVNGVMNFGAGRLAEHIGRKCVLLMGWVVAATVLLGANQGRTWSMTQTAKLDITRMQERGLTLGLNEFVGYVEVALTAEGSGETKRRPK